MSRLQTFPDSPTQPDTQLQRSQVVHRGLTRTVFPVGTRFAGEHFRLSPL
jgi:hypothetical protein